MAICCTVCGLWYATSGRDTLDICPDCVERNFSNPQPPLAWAAEATGGVPTARDALEAYVDNASALTLTPRQVQAMHRMAARWRRQGEAARARWEEEA